MRLYTEMKNLVLFVEKYILTVVFYTNNCRDEN